MAQRPPGAAPRPFLRRAGILLLLHCRPGAGLLGLLFGGERARVSNEELAALALSVYEDTRSKAAVSFQVTAETRHVVKSWVRAERVELEAKDMRVDVYRSDRRRACVLSVRGTVLSYQNFKANFDVALGSVNRNLAELVRHLEAVVRDTAAAHDRYSIFLTGHSLGAYVACLAYLAMARDPQLRRRILRVVLFESPGVPWLRHDDAVFPRFWREPWWQEAQGRIVEFLGAPNMINMVHRHVGGQVYRVKKDHCLRADGAYALTCALGSAGHALNLGILAIGARSWAQHHAAWRDVLVDPRSWLQRLARYEDLLQARRQARSDRRYGSWLVSEVRLRCMKLELERHLRSSTGHMGQVVAMLARAGATLNVAKFLWFMTSALQLGLGLVDEVAWTLQQHSMVGIWKSFDEGADLPRAGSYQVVVQWPQGVRTAVRNLVATYLRFLMPFHPAVPGLHNIGRPSSVMEARVCRLQGYIYEEPLLEPLPWSRQVALALRRLEGRGQLLAGAVRRACSQRVRSVARALRAQHWLDALRWHRHVWGAPLPQLLAESVGLPVLAELAPPPRLPPSSSELGSERGNGGSP